MRNSSPICRTKSGTNYTRMCKAAPSACAEPSHRITSTTRSSRIRIGMCIFMSFRATQQTALYWACVSGIRIIQATTQVQVASVASHQASWRRAEEATYELPRARRPQSGLLQLDPSARVHCSPHLADDVFEKRRRVQTLRINTDDWTLQRKRLPVPGE